MILLSIYCHSLHWSIYADHCIVYTCSPLNILLYVNSFNNNFWIFKKDYPDFKGLYLFKMAIIHWIHQQNLISKVIFGPNIGWRVEKRGKATRILSFNSSEGQIFFSRTWGHLVCLDGKRGRASIQGVLMT